MANIIDILAIRYTKHLALNPRDTIQANMQRAVDELPMIKAAPELLEALEDFMAIAAQAKPNCGPKLRALIQSAQEKHSEAIAKARGE